MTAAEQAVCSSIDRILRKGGGLYAVKLLSVQKVVNPELAEPGREPVRISSTTMEFSPVIHEQTTPSELDFILVHEAAHLLMGHTAWLRLRIYEKPDDAALLFKAAEFEANNVARRARVGQMPDYAIIPEKYDLPVDREFAFYVSQLRKQRDAQPPPQEPEPEPGDEAGDEGEGGAGGEGESADDGAEQAEQGDGDGDGDGSPGDADSAGDGDGTGEGEGEDAEGRGNGNSGAGAGDGDGGDGWSYGDIVDDGHASETEAQTALAVSAIHTAAALGSGASPLSNHAVDVLRKTKLKNAKEVLQRMVSAAEGGSSWHKLNKRMPGLLPGRGQDADVRYIIVAVDCSGSMGDDVIARAFGWMAEIAQRRRKMKFLVVWWDTAIHRVEEFRASALPKTVRRPACGGTRPECVLRWVVETKPPKVRGIVFLTDGEFCRPERPAGWRLPVGWMLSSPYAANPGWGTVGYF